MNVKLVQDADSGELYMLPDDEEAVKQTPLFVQEDVFPEIRIRTEDYDANSIIADLNKQLDEKVKAEQTAITKVEDVGFVCTKDESVTEEKSKRKVDKVAVGCLIAMIAILAFCVSTFFMSDETINNMNTTVEQLVTFDDTTSEVTAENVVTELEDLQRRELVDEGSNVTDAMNNTLNETLNAIFPVLLRMLLFVSVVLLVLQALSFVIKWFF